MDKLIEFLPQFIIYIVLGFIFLRFFRYMCTIKNSDKYEHIIWESLLVGFVLKQCYTIIPFSINYTVDIIGMIITTIIIAGIFAKIYSSKCLDKFLRLIGVHRTRNKYIWKDIEDPDYIINADVINPDTHEAYHGVIIYYEEFERNPQIVLNHYQYWEDWHNDEPTMDFTNDPSKIVLVDTTQFSRITISYDENSSKIKQIETEKTKSLKNKVFNKSKPIKTKFHSKNQVRK